MRGVSLRRRIITLFRIANTGLHNLLRNAWLTTAAIAVMTVTLTIVMSAVLANFVLQEAIEGASRDLTVSIFLTDDSSKEDQNRLLTQLEENEFVDSVYYKSKSEALTEFQTNNADNPTLLEGISIAGGNPLPASYEVFMNDIDQYQSILDIANDEQHSQVVLRTNDNQRSRDVFTGFTSTQSNINQASIILGAIFGSISILVIFNTIRMAIFTRSDEIEIMKLIGATPGYIRGPYLFEAASYGVIASVLSFSIVYALAVPFARQFLEGEAAVTTISLFPNGVVSYFTDSWYIVFAITLMTGIAIGYTSSSVAMAKYLRLKRW